MRSARKLPPLAVRAAAAIGMLLFPCFAGCSPEVVGVSDREDDHEAEHYVPPHFPQDALTGIARLRELLEPGTSATSRAMSDAPTDVSRRQEVFDLARWLPELAAETELDEQAWNRVRDASRTLERAASEATGDAPPSGPEIASAVQALSRSTDDIRDADARYLRRIGLDESPEIAIDADDRPASEEPRS